MTCREAFHRSAVERAVERLQEAEILHQNGGFGDPWNAGTLPSAEGTMCANADVRVALRRRPNLRVSCVPLEILTFLALHAL